MKIKFHQRFLNIFELDELNLMKSHADFSANKNGFIDVMLVRTDKVFVEIYTDGKSKELGYALIAVLDSEDNDLPLILTKDEFWSIYKSSKVVPTTDYSFELDL